VRRKKMALKEIAEAFLEDSSSGKVGEAFDKYVHKEYMPHIYELYDKYKKHVKKRTVLRLLGGDRGEIEEKTSEEWNKIVAEKLDKPEIARMTKTFNTMETRP